jgi:DNA-binding beta-propeller fold protein YncE
MAIWKKISILLPLLASAVAAQVSAPSLGLVYDAQNQALRRIAGTPGAATLSDPILGAIASAAIAPDHTFAIVDDGDYKLYTSSALRSLPVGLPRPARIVFSPAGETAAFYADGTFTVVTGLPGHPALQSVAAPGPVSQFAVTASGLLLMSIAQGGGESIYEIPPQGPPVHVLDVTQISAIVVSKDGTKAWMADAAENQIWFMSGLDSSPSAVQIASAADGLDSPVALALSPDFQQLFIANGGMASIVAFDLAHSAALSSTPCACKPAALGPLAAASVFALTDLSTGPMWIFDASQPVLQTLFIPAVPAVIP